MYTLRPSCAAFAVSFLLSAIAFAGGRDPTEIARGRYLPVIVAKGAKTFKLESEPRTIMINFNIDATFWVAQMSLKDFTENTLHINIRQLDSPGKQIFFRPVARMDEWSSAKVRLFFDAVFWAREPKQTRSVLVRRVDEDGHVTLYVEPVP